MNREIKFEYGFTNHAPVVFTLSEIQFGRVNELMYADVGSTKYRRQFTGLHDKNGREVYEGDVVQYEIWHGGPEAVLHERNNPAEDWKRPFVVYYDDCRFKLKPAYDFVHTIGDLSKYYLNEGLEVIGNIHDNPELIEEQQ